MIVLTGEESGGMPVSELVQRIQAIAASWRLPPPESTEYPNRSLKTYPCPS